MNKLIVATVLGLGLSLAPPLMHAQSVPQPGNPGNYTPGSTFWTSAADAARPTPRLPDGKPDLFGPWMGGGTNEDIEREGGMKPGELPLLPSAKEIRDKRDLKDEPYTICLPMSVPRKNPFPWVMVQGYTSKGMSHIFILHENGDAGGRRQIFMDGRKHPADATKYPTWWGHSIGWWEGDTLVVDTVGYNDKFWFDSRGTPHTEQLHTIERYSRPNNGTLINQFTMDDPGTFSKPVTMTFTAKLVRPGMDLMEYICQEDNQYGLASGLTPADEGGEKERAKQAAPKK